MGQRKERPVRDTQPPAEPKLTRDQFYSLLKKIKKQPQPRPTQPGERDGAKG